MGNSTVTLDPITLTATEGNYDQNGYQYGESHESDHGGIYL